MLARLGPPPADRLDVGHRDEVPASSVTRARWTARSPSWAATVGQVEPAGAEQLLGVMLKGERQQAEQALATGDLDRPCRVRQSACPVRRRPRSRPRSGRADRRRAGRGGKRGVERRPRTCSSSPATSAPAPTRIRWLNSARSPWAVSSAACSPICADHVELADRSGGLGCFVEHRQRQRRVGVAGAIEQRAAASPTLPQRAWITPRR